MQYLNMLPYQVRTAIDKNYPVVLPLGVIEYHAEHLPLGTGCSSLEVERKLVSKPGSAAAVYAVRIDCAGGRPVTGYLSIPALELNLPIMSQWDSARLKIAPCRYFGSVNGEDLVLMAHNYASHFGRIKELKLGDEVIFTDMDGFSTRYLVVNKDVLSPYAVEEVTSGDFDLTLFTCTYGGENRIGVYCEIE
jgi:LPXTG-site transpeptidase (sortase) family protein